MKILRTLLFVLWVVLATAPASAQKTLIVIDLAGGNDGLNTVIPYTDPAYATLRPHLAVDAHNVLPLTATLGWHPALAPLLAPWKDGDLGVVLGVGYSNPNRSHFRSIAIWNTASDADTVTTTGWLARLVKALPPDKTRLADALVLGDSAPGPVAAPWMHNLTLSSLDGFLRAAGDLGLLQKDEAPEPAEDQACNQDGPQYEVAAVGGDIARWALALQKLKPTLPDYGDQFPKTAFGKQAQLAAQLLTAGVNVPVVKLTLRGFDTHVDQAKAQEGLLKDFADTLVALRQALKQAGRWSDTVVMTYSEFGRRAEENGSAGTDHGTASPVFLLGGKVAGGALVGTQPSLSDLNAGDLKYTTDFHEVYASVVKQFWGLTDAQALFDITGGKAGDLPLFYK